jgi:hypothetical protein
VGIANRLRDFVLRRRHLAARLLGSRFRIPLRAWIFVLCVFYRTDKERIKDNKDNRTTY